MQKFTDQQKLATWESCSLTEQNMTCQPYKPSINQTRILCGGFSFVCLEAKNNEQAGGVL